jgi:energy-coupling factor transporter transmembrane protein EcfT
MQNNNNGIKKSFIPRNKPKSFVVAIIAALIGGLCGGPLMFGGHFLNISSLIVFGKILFVFCWIVFAIMGIFFAFGMLAGRYRDMQEKDWTQQIW